MYVNIDLIYDNGINSINKYALSGYQMDSDFFCELFNKFKLRLRMSTWLKADISQLLSVVSDATGITRL
jgi:hypothetical protein